LWLRFARKKGSPKLETIGGPLTFTAVYMPVPEGYIGFVEEIPGTNSQGETLDEVRENLREAVQLVLEANRELAEQALAGKNFEREPFELAS
jgi:predicted RNase H-like HicB family nuclease